MRVGYLVVGENLLGSGILRSQVISMVRHLRPLKGIEKVRILWWSHPFHLWKERHSFLELKREFSDVGIDVTRFLLPAGFKWGWPLIVATLFFVVPILCWQVWRYRLGVLHCRSYPASLGGWFCRRLLKVRFIFDPRGPYPEEAVINQRWHSRGFSYRLWKRIEKILCRESDAVIAVSGGWVKYYQRLGGKRVFLVVNRTGFPNISDLPRPIVPPAVWRVIFIGEMEAYWYNPEKIGYALSLLLNAYPNLEAQIVTRAPYNKVAAALNSNSEISRRTAITSAHPQDIPKVLTAAHFGLITGEFVEEVFPVKTGEYLAAGLPLIVGAEVGETLVNLIKRRRLGILVDFTTGEGVDRLREVMENYEEWSDRCRKYAIHRLHIRSTARQLHRIYRLITKSSLNSNRAL